MPSRKLAGFCVNARVATAKRLGIDAGSRLLQASLQRMAHGNRQGKTSPPCFLLCKRTFKPPAASGGIEGGEAPAAGGFIFTYPQARLVRAPVLTLLPTE